MKIDAETLRKYAEETQCALVVGHISPDGDAVGSVLAFTEALRNRGAAADALFADRPDRKFEFLPVLRDAVNELPDKAYDTIFFLDLSTPDRAGDIAWPQAPVVNIDHHVSNPDYADALYLEPQAAATGEILTALFLDWGWEITPSMAQALYMAIATDCGFFSFPNTSARTLRMAAELLERGAQPPEISRAMDSLPPEALHAMGPIMSTLRTAADGRLNYIVMDEEAMALAGEYVDNYLMLARNVQGIELTIQFKYDRPDHTRISFRSQEYTDVSKLAAVFGGGGHIRAAGCTVDLPLAEAVAKVVPLAESWVRDGRSS
ncbi:MAG: bifunctional oligoribonuclease/PAP phosphatase NrnA [Veillonellaceae bacterium]|nr:bifunctional oligoribonuclease/PAP phosphatase NrnA [Veillonellaceae bacterium]